MVDDKALSKSVVFLFTLLVFFFFFFFFLFFLVIILSLLECMLFLLPNSIFSISIGKNIQSQIL